jgi:hypothetical protein
LNGIISSNQKAVLTFWRFKNPLPACRAFSHYAQKDDRVDNKILEAKFSPLPETAKEQNSLWYKISKYMTKNEIYQYPLDFQSLVAYYGTFDPLNTVALPPLWITSDLKRC